MRLRGKADRAARFQFQARASMSMAHKARTDPFLGLTTGTREVTQVPQRSEYGPTTEVRLV